MTLPPRIVHPWATRGFFLPMIPVTRLFPAPMAEQPLQGLYLGHALRTLADDAERPFVYTNFITSLDGRIALAAGEDDALSVPKTLANGRDWRLFQELAVQADVMLSSGRYLRDYAAGRAQEILRTNENPALADLASWRAEHGLAPSPDLAVISASLDFALPDAIWQGRQRVVIVTTEAAPRAAKEALATAGATVILAGERRVSGSSLIQGLAALGYRTIYSAAGPQVLHTLLVDGLVQRFYLTLAARLLGGDAFSTLLQGPMLTPPASLRLHTAYLDPAGLDGAGQLFLSYTAAV